MERELAVEGGGALALDRLVGGRLGDALERLDARRIGAGARLRGLVLRAGRVSAVATTGRGDINLDDTPPKQAVRWRRLGPGLGVGLFYG